MNHHRWVVAVALSAFGCRPSAPPSPAEQSAYISPERPAESTALAAAVNGFDKILPASAQPFAAATPIQLGQGYFRRAYVSGAERVEITIARSGNEPGAYEHWVAGSASYPQAQLSLPVSEADGFFSCASELADAACDLHIQLRAGFHVEVMGNGRVPRQDLTELMTCVQLGALADSALPALSQ